MRIRWCVLLLLALFVVTRGALFLALRPWEPPRRATHFLVSDAAEYYWTAHNLLTHSTHSSEPADPPRPDAVRTPGYPLFLAALLATAGDSISAMVLAQILLQAVTLALIYLGTTRLFSQWAAFWVTFYCVLDPVYLGMAGWLYSETLYQLGNVVLVYLLVVGLRYGFSWRSAAAVGACAGLGLLIRPFALYFIPVVALTVVAADRSIGRGFAKGAVMLACVIALILPWAARNRVRLGAWSLSTVEGTSLQQFYVAPFLAWRQGISLHHARAELAAATPVFENPFERVAFIKRQTAAVITAHPLEYAVFHFTSAWPALTGANSEALAAALSAAGPTKAMTPGPAWLRDPLIAANVALLASLYALFGLGLMTLWQRGERGFALLLAAGVVYLPLVTGPMSSSRYRLAIVPFLLAGAAVAIERLRQPRALPMSTAVPAQTAAPDELPLGGI
jgi:hypothetical protein